MINFIKKYYPYISIFILIINFKVVALVFAESNSSSTPATNSEVISNENNNDIDQLLNILSQEEDDNSLEDNTNKNNELTSKKLGESSKDHKDSLFEKANFAKIIILNKITAKSAELIMFVGETKTFGNFTIKLYQCMKNIDPPKFNDAMLISASDKNLITPNIEFEKFNGWLIPDNLSLLTIEHPIYEIIPIECTMKKAND